MAPENHAQPATTPTDLVLDVVFLPTSGLHDQQSFWQAQFGRWAQEKLWVRQIYWPSVLADPVLDTSTVVSSSPAPGDNVAVSEALDPAAVAVEDAFTISAGPFVAPTMVWQQFRKWREFRKLRRRDPVNRQRPRKLLVLSGQNQATLDAINQADFPARLRTALTQTEYEVVLLLNDGNETSLVGENTIRSENSTSVAETTTLATTTTTSSS
ncbi:MAG: hypothetical protein J6Y94_04965, partial [Bacteriovoracaceae bacterium]|nr:hypothetical protein [Bacteriovoracaceae bacterium]